MALRILAVDHFYDQDLAALRAALTPGERLDVVPYQRLLRLAKRCFPEEAFTGVVAALGPNHDIAWRRYRSRIGALAQWWLAAYQPTVLVLPSDAIFYFRPLIEEFRARGVPTVVVQKETTISPMVMHDHAAVVAESVPFISDAMAVCSERHRDFWVRAGADPDRVVVTGQPRFDVYAGAVAVRTSGPRRLLYLSYDDKAYLPSDTGVPYLDTWVDLRRQTEQEVAGAAAQGWDVVVKRHPQQAAAADWLGPDVRRAPQGADTRKLILESDVVVGFQTTALFEALAAKRAVVYAAWGDAYERARPMLIPFEAYERALLVARSASELRVALTSDAASLQRDPSKVCDVVVEHIGAVDGLASARALELVRRTAAKQPPAAGGVAARLRLRAVLAGAGARLLRRAADVATGDIAAPLARRAEHWQQEAAEARAVRTRA